MKNSLRIWMWVSVLLAGSSLPCGAQAVITTVAGTGTGGFSGDGGAATNAKLGGGLGVAVDNSGNLLIVDGGNNRIRKVDAAGIITTIAGGGSAVGGGDGGLATNAQVFPGGVAVDGAGNLYIAQGASIRKVNSAGIISTVAGNGLPGFSGDGGPATSATIFCTNVAADTAGNVYFPDSLNQRIRKIDTAGVITTVAGDRAAGLLRRRRAGDQRDARAAARPDGGPRGEPVLRGQCHAHPQGGHERDHYDGRGQREPAGSRRRRSSYQRRHDAYVGRGGCGGQPVHRGHGRREDPQGQYGGDHQHAGGGRPQRRAGERRWRPADERLVRQHQRGGGGRGRKCVHRGQRRRPHPRGLLGRRRLAGDGQPGFTLVFVHHGRRRSPEPDGGDHQPGGEPDIHCRGIDDLRRELAFREPYQRHRGDNVDDIGEPRRPGAGDLQRHDYDHAERGGQFAADGPGQTHRECRRPARV